MRGLIAAGAIALAAAAVPLATAAAEEIKLVISAALPQKHMWVGHHMDPFADLIEKETGGRIAFDRYYAGELVSVGREYDGLTGHTIDVSAPFLAPYQEGRFPLSDVTQLPTLGTDSPMITRAFQKLLDSKEPLKDGKTFYELELTDNGLVGWPLGASQPYAISTTGKVLDDPSDFQGLPARGGATLHVIGIEKLGATPVYMPAAEAYEALSRGTIEGILLSIGDWRSYSVQELLKYTITGINMGSWESYLAMRKDSWDGMPDDLKEIWDRVARQAALDNAAYVVQQDEIMMKEASEQYGSQFVDIKTLSPEMQAHMAKAATETWKAWIDKMESEGEPGLATARLWARLITEEGGELPPGVAEILQ